MNCIICKNWLEPESAEIWNVGNDGRITLLGITEVNPSWEIYTCRLCSYHNRFNDKV